MAALRGLGWQRVAFPLGRRHVSVAVGFGFGSGRRARGGLVARTGHGGKALFLVPILHLQTIGEARRVFDFTRNLSGSSLRLSEKAQLPISTTHAGEKKLASVRGWMKLTCSPWCPFSAKEQCRQTVIDQMRW